MEKEYPYGDNSGSSKRPWDLVESAQHVPPDPDHGHWKRQCPSGSFEYTNSHIQLPLPLNISLTSSNSAYGQPVFGEQRLGFSSECKTNGFSRESRTDLPSLLSEDFNILDVDSTKSSSVGSLLYTQFGTQSEEVDAGNGLAGNISSCQIGGQRTQQSHDHAVPEDIEENSDAGYNTCFGMVLSLLPKRKTQECCG